MAESDSEVKEKDKKPKAPPLKNEDIIRFLNMEGFTFRGNLVSGKIEVTFNEVTQDLADGIWGRIVGKGREISHDVGMAMANERAILHAINDNADRNSYSPIKEYLEKCNAKFKESGLSGHLKELIECIHVSPCDESRRNKFMQAWLFGCAGRVFHNFQNYTLIAQGPQGIGKSSLFESILRDLPNYYDDAELNPLDKDHVLKLSNKFIWQMDEFGKTLKNNNRNAIKAFLTKGNSDVRASYDRYSKLRPRMCSLAGSMNDDEFLTDPTGNRRYLVVPMKAIDLDKVKSLDIQLIWGEIVHYALEFKEQAYKLDAEGLELQIITNEEAEVFEPILDHLKMWLTKTGDTSHTVKSADILRKVNSLHISNINYLPGKIAELMKKLGYEKYRNENWKGYKGVAWNAGFHPDATLDRDKLEAEKRINPKK